jgi:hypothetical protein
MNKGFILIEALVSLIAAGFLLIVISGISLTLIHFPEIPFVSQVDVFKLQLEQLVSLGTNFHIKDQQLCFDLDVRHFCFKTEDNRIVKIPGYEILLDDVTNIRLELNNYEIIIHGVYDQKSFTFSFKHE